MPHRVCEVAGRFLPFESGEFDRIDVSFGGLAGRTVVSIDTADDISA